MIPTKNAKSETAIIQLPLPSSKNLPVMQCCAGMILLSGYAAAVYLSINKGQLFLKELMVAGALIVLLAAHWKLSMTAEN